MRAFRPAFTTAFLGFLVGMSVLGCSCSQTPPPQPDPPVDVAPTSLVRMYRDTPDIAHTSYTGRRIRCVLAAKTFEAVEGGVGWFTGFLSQKPVLVFRLDRQVPVDTTVEVVGVCRGPVRDGHRRGPGIDWYLLVTECSTTPLPASP